MDKTKVLKTSGSLVQVKSIAECSGSLVQVKRMQNAPPEHSAILLTCIQLLSVLKTYFWVFSFVTT